MSLERKISAGGVVTHEPLNSRAIMFCEPVRMLVDVVMIADVLIVVATAVVARFIYLDFVLETNEPMQLYLAAGCIAGVTMSQVMRLQGLYDSSALLRWPAHIWKLLFSIVLSFLIVIAFGYLAKLSAAYSRGWLLVWLGLCVVAMCATRFVAVYVIKMLVESGAVVKRALVLVSGSEPGRLEQLRNAPDLVGSRFVFVNFENAEETAGAVRALVFAGEGGEFDEVIIAATGNLAAMKSQLIEPLSDLSVDVWLYMTDLAMPVHAATNFGRGLALQVRRRPEPTREWSYIVKQGLDYVGAAVGLVILSPLMLMAAIAIKLDSPGPVFFIQRRNGFNQRIINVFKFRTMTVAEDDVVVQATRGDRRVTRVGRILRSTSIDELPQLLNVLRGEMSLVGPRPHALSHNEHYGRLLQHYRHRHTVKPGITGHAQVNGYRGPTDDIEKMRKRVEFDMFYIENWSLWLDIEIIAKTVVKSCMHENAV